MKMVEPIVADTLPEVRSSVHVPFRPACRIVGAGTRSEGTVERSEDGGWSLRFPERQPMAQFAGAKRIGLMLNCDVGICRRLRVGELPVTDFTVDDAGHRILFRPNDPVAAGARLYRLRAPVPATVRARALFRCALEASIEASSPFEIAMTASDPDGFLVPSTVLTLTVDRPWGGHFEMTARICTRKDGPEEASFVLRPLGRRSTKMAGWFTACESSEFTIRHLRMMGLPVSGIQRHFTVIRAHGPAEMDDVRDLRKVANQFFGRRRGVNEDDAWSDGLDRVSINILARLGDKPIGTGRLVVNNGDRAFSEIEEAVGLPDWIWAERFVEISRVAIDPDHRDSDVMIMIFREMGRLALELGCRYMVLDSIERLIPIYEKVGAVRLPLTKKHPYSDETVHVMFVDVRRVLTGLDRRLPYWFFVFSPVLGQHVKVFGHHGLDEIIGEKRGLPIGFALKRVLGHIRAPRGT
jgi:hypothetical protein